MYKELNEKQLYNTAKNDKHSLQAPDLGPAHTECGMLSGGTHFYALNEFIRSTINTLTTVSA